MRGRILNRLTATKVAALKISGLHADGGGLYLKVAGSRRSWIFRYSWRGKKQVLGLGSARSLSLAKARELAAGYRAFVAEDKNPRTERDRADRRVSFGSYADDYVGLMSSSWKNKKHVAQWTMTLTVYAKPIRSKILEEITTDDVLKLLKPLWLRIPETADRLRGRIEKILDAAKVAGLREGDNPARWRGHLEHLLPRRRKGGRGHHAALSFVKVPSFFERLRARDAKAARALEFTILTAARSSEVLEADWSEIDLRQKIWIVPPDRMKGDRLHRVPLSQPAIDILADTPADQRHGRIFKRDVSGKALTNMAMPMLLRRMEVTETVHGFRSSFRDWASEMTDYSNEVCEMALAHVIAGKTEAAYRRGDLFLKRRRLMDEWAAHCGGVTN